MPEMDVNKDLKKFLTIHKPLKVAYGGRGSGKSIGFGDMLTFKMDTESADIYCLREYQDSLSESVHRVFKGSINNRLKLKGWDIQQSCVIAPNGAQTRYVGAARNPDSIQSAEGYKYSWFEEAHRASQASLDKLLPTILRSNGAECWFSGNPQSSGDPFSKRFITPYQDEIEKNGFYEDNIHLIIKVNWRNNPWWNEAQEKLRQWDFENMTRAKYDWIWEGAFNDSVESPLILAEWFDACIDAHKKLGFEPRGMKFAIHDPSDTGPDNKAFGLRHGPVLIDLKEKETGDVNEGCDWATGLAINHNADAFTWDIGGMGTALKRQVATAFNGKKTTISQFDGSKGVDNPDNIFDPVSLDVIIQDQKTIKDCIKNRRAQYYLDLRQAIYRTFQAVTMGVYHDPDTLLSIDSSIKVIQKLRSELCRMPVKPNSSGLFEMYSKEELKNKFKFDSPNLADVVMMSRRVPKINKITNFTMPKPIRPMGRRN